jgi:hypothetical protein
VHLAPCNRSASRPRCGCSAHVERTGVRIIDRRAPWATCLPTKYSQNAASASDARCHAYAGRQTPTSRIACPAVTARRSGDLHASAPISVLVVWVLRVHLRLPPAKALAHDRARGSHERTSKRACAARLCSLPTASTTRFPSLAQPRIYFLRLCSSIAYLV